VEVEFEVAGAGVSVAVAEVAVLAGAETGEIEAAVEPEFVPEGAVETGAVEEEDPEEAGATASGSEGKVVVCAPRVPASRAVARGIQVLCTVVLHSCGGAGQEYDYLTGREMAKEFDNDRDLHHLRDLAGQVESYRLQAEELGRLQAGRALLECPSCGLREDELADLTLVVSTPEEPGTDTGLRFVELEGGGWMCPSCHALVPPPPASPSA
jgi:hypothetical protein